MIYLIKKIGIYLISIIFLLVVVPLAVISRLKGYSKENVRIVWGSTPILTNAWWSKSMKKAGYNSETFVTNVMSINNANDWDHILTNKFFYTWRPLKPFLAFMYSLLRFDVFIISFDGYFLGKTPLQYLQAQILKLAGKKIVIMPYGSDAYVYKYIYSPELIHALQLSYPHYAREQDSLAKNMNYWVKYSNAVIPGQMGLDGFGRWDVLTPSPIAIDLDDWKISKKNSKKNGIDGKVTIAHCPNHRGFKGTEFISIAVETLQNEGLDVELRLVENLKNSEVKNILTHEVDILIDQVIYTGYALNATEGMASGLPVISNMERESELINFRRWSFLDECPLVSASPETLINVLRKLVIEPETRSTLGKAGRQYCEKYHGLDSGAYLFKNVIEFIHGEKNSLLNLYHPISGDYTNRSPKIKHPLIKNKFVN